MPFTSAARGSLAQIAGQHLGRPEDGGQQVVEICAMPPAI